ncbi:alpha/beta fold hydrolase [Rhodoplanes sp. Z2-YC6860]|uniref:alpha/beta fold hydrolase n=1 Tax=Rhodoplanes sp. Z2-YC6860 TaxID=674703 RepID=UPI0018DD9893|nr:alpha/beta hydrolase [Rhodoplanes sp. Z2-YC6860]
MPAFAAAPDHIMVSHGDARLEVLAQGKGPTIVMLPSLGRGATDFDAIADKLAEAGFRVLRPEPRGIGKSTGPWQGVKLEDLAADIAAVIEQDKNGPAFVVGHAFGNRVARMLATARPELVAGVSLIAANVGRNPSPPNVRAAIRLSADLKASDDERVKAMQFVFFAPGSDARVWLKGWHPDVLAAQRIAGDLTAREIDYAAGKAPVLYIQPSHDPLARVDEAEEYKKALGDRVTVVVIPNSAHAVIIEQPQAVSDALIAYARKLWPASAPK